MKAEHRHDALDQTHSQLTSRYSHLGEQARNAASDVQRAKQVLDEEKRRLDGLRTQLFKLQQIKLEAEIQVNQMKDRVSCRYYSS